MPVTRFHTLEAASEALWRDPSDPAHPRDVARLWELAERLAPLRYPPGVYRYRTLQEAQLQREAWEADPDQPLGPSKS